MSALKTYQEVKDFIANIETKKEELEEDISELAEKLEKLKASENDMLKFYGKTDTYYNAKMMAV